MLSVAYDIAEHSAPGVSRTSWAGSGASAGAGGLPRRALRKEGFFCTSNPNGTQLTTECRCLFHVSPRRGLQPLRPLWSSPASPHPCLARPHSVPSGPVLLCRYMSPGTPPFPNTSLWPSSKNPTPNWGSQALWDGPLPASPLPPPFPRCPGSSCPLSWPWQPLSPVQGLWPVSSLGDSDCARAQDTMCGPEQGPGARLMPRAV